MLFSPFSATRIGRHAGRPLHPLDGCRANARGAEIVEQRRAEDVLAYRAHHLHRIAQPRRCNGLVRPFASGSGIEACADKRSARGAESGCSAPPGRY